MSEVTDSENVYEKLPGLRDYSGARASHNGHGIDEILDVIGQLSAAGIPSCVVGVKALRYYGAGRIADEWDLCVPDDKLEAACQLLLRAERNGDTKYEVAKPPYPVPGSLRHTFPCFRLKGYNFWFILVPSSDCFVDPSRADHVERSKNGVPYASLVQFARSLLVQKLWADISDFIDGMDLTIEWGERATSASTPCKKKASSSPNCGMNDWRVMAVAAFRRMLWSRSGGNMRAARPRSVALNR
ncbi:hypothetical protein VTK56DRAFT_1529 [Thermocarpiscus australiensis]